MVRPRNARNHCRREACCQRGLWSGNILSLLKCGKRSLLQMSIQESCFVQGKVRFSQKQTKCQERVLQVQNVSESGPQQPTWLKALTWRWLHSLMPTWCLSSAGLSFRRHRSDGCLLLFWWFFCSGPGFSFCRNSLLQHLCTRKTFSKQISALGKLCDIFGSQFNGQY